MKEQHFEQNRRLPAVRQLVLTDMSGARSFNVTIKSLRRQLSALVKKGRGEFHIQITPPVFLDHQEQLKQISCLYQRSRENPVTLTAFCWNIHDTCRILKKSTAPEQAGEWLGKFFDGALDFTGWESLQAAAREEGQTGEAGHWHEFSVDQNGLMTYWRKLLIIEEEYPRRYECFSVRDVELAIEGICDGTCRKAVLEWGAQEFDLLPGTESDVTVIWRADTGGGNVKFLARKGTVVQAKFWLAAYLRLGYFEEISGWTDVTASVKKHAIFKGLANLRR